jgi:hypothetical protein
MSDGYVGEESVLAPPDLIEHVVGVRTFDRAGHALASPFQGDEWRQPEQRAVCAPDRRGHTAALVGLGKKPPAASKAAARVVARQRRLPRHAAPGDDCACGIYAYHDLDSEFLPDAPIVGVVQAWGRLAVHACGFRAERVRVVALALHDDLGFGVQADRYREVARRASAWWKVPLLRFEELAASLPEFGSPVPEELRPRDDDEEES